MEVAEIRSVYQWVRIHRCRNTECSRQYRLDRRFLEEKGRYGVIRWECDCGLENKAWAGMFSDPIRELQSIVVTFD